MPRSRLLIVVCTLVSVVSACDAGVVATTTMGASSLVSDGQGSVSTAPTTTTSAGPPLVVDGCARFDGETLGALTGLNVPLALVQENSTSERLVCHYVGTSDDVDTGVRVEVLPLDARPPGFWTTAGEFESPVVVAGVPVVGTGRGTLRTAVSDVGGLTLTVTLRRSSADAPAIRDGDHLDVRDAVAAYVIGRLG